ncbi:SHOCT domain-containing protein [Diaminobutyricibacter sp. McL0608]|uniref:SHOCT domain-containing protein n=1 Tax=Leifsonia sp. McL0608 TaxID=3143537 RepID=UPI0031F32801
MAADKKTLAGIEEILHDGEKVQTTLRAALWVSNSSNANPSGLLALTDERLIFAGSVRHTLTLVTHPLTDLRSIEFERALIASFLRIGTGDEAAPTITTFRPNPGLAPRFVDAVTAAMARASASEPAPPAAAPADASTASTEPAPASAAPSTEPAPSSAVPGSTADELAKIADLHDRGALTDEEFAAAKAKILGV